MKSQDLRIIGYPINAEKYGDKDAMVTFLSRDKIISYKARNGYLPGGKNHGAAMIFNKVEVDLAVNDDHHTVKSVTTLENNVSLYEDFEHISVMNFIREILVNMFTEDDEVPFDMFEKSLTLMKEKWDSLTVALVFLAHALTLIGVRPRVDSCSNCGKTKNLVHFSMSDGGFLCNSCAHEFNLKSQNITYLKTMKYIFNVSTTNLGEHPLNSGIAKDALTSLIDFVQVEFGFKLKSAKFILED